MKKITSIIAYNFLLLTLSTSIYGMDKDYLSVQKMQVYADTQPFLSKNYNYIITNDYLRASLLAVDPDVRRAIISGEKEFNYQVSAEELGSFIPQEEFESLGSSNNLYKEHITDKDCLENNSIFKYNERVYKHAQKDMNETKSVLQHLEYYLVENLLNKPDCNNDRHREYIKFILDNLGHQNVPTWVGITDIAEKLFSVQNHKDFPKVTRLLYEIAYEIIREQVLSRNEEFEAFLQEGGLGEMSR